MSEWAGIVQRLAAFERREPQAVATSIEYQLIDVTSLRASNDIVIRGSIPLEAGVGLVSSAWSMLRAAATTSIRTRAHIGGSYSKLADEVASQARLGHTREGSYIIPVLMPLPEPKSDSTDEPPIAGMEIERVAFEPQERRVMRTFAQALAAVNSVVIAPERTPTATQLQAAVVAGVSRELVSALHRVVTDESVSQFDASFAWAEGVGEPAGVPTTVSIPAAAAPRLADVTRLLRAARYTEVEIITGPIVEIRHVPNDPFGDISIQTMRRGRQAEVRVRIGEPQLTSAYDWARDGRPVLCEGTVTSLRGRPLRVEAPRRVQPLDEEYLTSPTG
jgi:hypothetical protein